MFAADTTRTAFLYLRVRLCKHFVVKTSRRTSSYNSIGPVKQAKYRDRGIIMLTRCSSVYSMPVNRRVKCLRGCSNGFLPPRPFCKLPKRVPGDYHEDLSGKQVNTTDVPLTHSDTDLIGLPLTRGADRLAGRSFNAINNYTIVTLFTLPPDL